MSGLHTGMRGRYSLGGGPIIFVCVYVCNVCVCPCVCQRERERERGSVLRGTKREKRRKGTGREGWGGNKLCNFSVLDVAFKIKLALKNPVPSQLCLPPNPPPNPPLPYSGAVRV